MRTSDPFTALGVPRDCDAATVRRRYAELLREVRPEDDPERFQRLRAAYDLCLAALRSAKPALVSPTAPVPNPGIESAGSSAPTSDPIGMECNPAAPLPAASPVDDAVREILRNARIEDPGVEALQARLDATLEGGSLEFARALERSLARALSADGPWDPAALRRIVDRFEWDRLMPTSSTPPELRDPAFRAMVAQAARAPDAVEPWPERPSTRGALVAWMYALLATMSGAGSVLKGSSGSLPSIAVLAVVLFGVASLACAWGAWRLGARLRGASAADAEELRWRRNILVLFATALMIAGAVIAVFG